MWQFCVITVQPFLDGYFLGSIREFCLKSAPAFSPCIITICSTDKKYIFLRTGLWSYKTGQLKAFSSHASCSRKRADECTWVSYSVWWPPEKGHKFSLDYHVLSSWLCISMCVAQLDIFNLCAPSLDEQLLMFWFPLPCFCACEKVDYSILNCWLMNSVSS